MHRLKVLLSIFLPLMPRIASAQGNFIVCGQTADDPCTIADAFTLVSMIINILIQMAGVVAVVMLIIAGYKMTMAGISGKPADYEEGKTRIKNVILGLILIFVSYVLVNTVMTFLLGNSTWANPW